MPSSMFLQKIQGGFSSVLACHVNYGDVDLSPPKIQADSNHAILSLGDIGRRDYYFSYGWANFWVCCELCIRIT